MALLARRFVAGEDRKSMIDALRLLNKNGMSATIDFLGENVNNRETALSFGDEYLRILEDISDNKLNANVSVKLSCFGLEIDPDFCFENFLRVVDKADEKNIFVRIDMEGSGLTQATIDMFERVKTVRSNVGIVLQAYLYRTEADVGHAIERKDSVRLCKGAYKEPPEIAFAEMEDVNANYEKLATRLLQEGVHAAIATHDNAMIDRLQAYIHDNAIHRSRYEWQMLYGINRSRQLELAQAGENIRIYVPYGSDWMGYFMRRIAERKENLLFVLKHLFEKRI